MADDNIVLGIEIGNSKQLINTVEDIERLMRKLGASIEDMPQLTETQSLEELNEAQGLIGSMSDEVSALGKAISKAGREKLLDTKQVKQLTQSLDGYDRSVSQLRENTESFIANTPLNIQNATYAYEQMAGVVDGLTLGYERQAYAAKLATDPKLWTRLNKQASSTADEIQETNEALAEMENSLAFMGRTGGEALTSASSIDEIAVAIDKVNAGVEASKKAFEAAKAESDKFTGSLRFTDEGIIAYGKLQTATQEYKDAVASVSQVEDKRFRMLSSYTSSILGDMETLTDQQARLVNLRGATEDPEILRQVDERMESINEKIERKGELLVEQSTTDTFIQSVENMEAAESTLDSTLVQMQRLIDDEARLIELRSRSTNPEAIDLINKKLTSMRAEYQDLANTLNNDFPGVGFVRLVDQLEGAEEKYANIVAEMERLKAQEAELAELRVRTNSPEALALIEEKEAQINARYKERADILANEMPPDRYVETIEQLDLQQDRYAAIAVEIEQLQEQQRELAELKSRTEDPQALKLIEQREARINALYKERSETLLSGATTDTLAAELAEAVPPARSTLSIMKDIAVTRADILKTKIRSGEAEDRQLKKLKDLQKELASNREYENKVAESRAKYNQKITENEIQLKTEILERKKVMGELAAIRMRVDDPDKLQLILDKEKQITAEIEERQNALKANATMRSQRNPLASDAGAGASIMNMFGGASAAANSIAEFSSVISDFTGIIGDVVPSLKDAADIFGDNAAQMSEFFVALGGIFEQQQGTFQQVMDVQREIGGFGKQLKGWSTNIESANRAITNSGRSLSTFRQGIGGLGKGMGRMSSVLGGVAKYAGVAGAALQGAQVGFQVYDLAMGRSTDQINRRIATFYEEQEAIRQLNELYEEGSQEAIDAQIEAKREEIRQARAYAEFVRQNATEMTSAFDQGRTVLGSFLGDTNVYGTAAEELEGAVQAVRDLEAEIEELSGAAATAAVQIGAFEREVERSARQAYENIEQRERELFNARVDIIESQEETINKLDELQENYDAETVALTERRHQQDRDAVREHLNNLEGMEADHAKKVEEFRVDHFKELEKVEEKYLQNLADELRKYQDDRAETIAEFNEAEHEALMMFQEEQVEAKEDYDKKLAKMEEDFNKERIKRQKDLEEQLFEAEMDNDALRYFMLQRQGEQEEAEAQEQHAEKLTETEKAFKEEQKERAEQFAEKKKERAADHADELKAMKEAHTKKVAEIKRGFDEEVKAQQKNLKERLAQQETFYAEERARAAQNYRERQAERDEERAREDNARLERLQTRRQELEDTFQAELEYFRRREDALEAYISTIGDMETSRGELVDFVRGGRGVVSRDNMELLVERLDNMGERILSFAPDGDISQLTNQQQHELIAIQNTAETLRYQLGQMHPSASQAAVDLYQGVDLDMLASAGVDFEQNLIDAINVSSWDAMSNAQEALDFNLEYLGRNRRAIAEEVQWLTGNNMTVWRNLAEEHQDALQQMGLSQEDWNMMTVQEQEEFLQNQQDILRRQGEESTDALQTTADEIGDNAISTFETIKDDTRSSNQQLIADNQAHWSERQTDEDSFQQDIKDAQEIANEDRLVEEDSYNEAALALEQAGGEAELDEQEGSQDDALQSQARFNEDTARQQEDANANQLTAEQAFYGNRNEMLASMFQLEMERLMLKFEAENEMWIMFMENLEKVFSSTMKRIFHNISRTVTNDGNNIVRSYGRINEAIVMSAAQAYTELLAYLIKAKEASEKIGLGGWGSGGSGSGRGKGLLAAKGALINEPTLLIAGEGDSPELVMPFDESKGIPDEVARQFASAMSGGSGIVGGDELAPERIGGAMNDQLLGAILTQLTRMQTGMDLTIERIDVGSGVSRQEIREQFKQMQHAIVEVMDRSVNIN